MFVSGSDEKRPVPDEIWNYPMRGNTRIAVLFSREGAVITAPFSGGTFRDWTNQLYKALRKLIETNASEMAYSRIGYFLHSNRRKDLVDKFERGELRPIDLAGDHVYFEGGLTTKDNVWVYSLGS